MNPQIFNDLIDESPPSTVDIDAIFAQERRSVRRRRVAGVGVAGLVVMAVAVGTLAYAGSAGPGTSTTRRGYVEVAEPPARRTPWPPEAVASIRRELKDVVSRVVPSVRLSELANRGIEGPFDNPKLPGGADGLMDFEAYSIHLSVTLGNRKGELSITLMRDLVGAGPRLSCDLYFGACLKTVGPNGEGILIDKQVVPAEFYPNPTISYYALVDRGDGVTVTIDHQNHVNTGPTSDATPLTEEQLKQIALDPALVPSP